MFDRLLQANEAYAREFAHAELLPPPSQRLAVVTCMDARIEPLAVLGLDLGSAHVLRNAGGRVTGDVLRSLAVSHNLLGVGTVAVIHHTECGMRTMTDADMRRVIAEATGADTARVEFLTISDRTEALDADVAQIRDSAMLPGMTVAGYLYDVKTGRLEEVIAPRSR